MYVFGVTRESSAPQASQSVSQQQLVVQPACAQVLQSSAGGSVQPPVTLLHQVVQGSESQIQLNMIRLQVQNNPSQPIIIQAQPQHSPQIIQVTSQGQHQPQQQVYLAQVATSQDDS